MKIFYHDDMDGRCCARTVLKRHTATNAELFPMQHDGREFPLDNIQKGEKVYILDYSIPKETMNELLDITGNVIWIDHHITAIQNYADFERRVFGLRTNGIAACELTYELLFGSKPPRYIQLIGDRDVWKFDFGDDTRNFFAGASVEDTHPLSPVWELMHTHPEHFIEQGKIVRKYQENQCEKTLERFGYSGDLWGYSAILCNASIFTSELFGEEAKNFDIMVVYAFDGEKYQVSLYSTKVDVGQIAKHYGGGGHEKAAGFRCVTLPFGA